MLLRTVWDCGGPGRPHQTAAFSRVFKNTTFAFEDQYSVETEEGVLDWKDLKSASGALQTPGNCMQYDRSVCVCVCVCSPGKILFCFFFLQCLLSKRVKRCTGQKRVVISEGYYKN
jgi:hypothetical protein